MEIAKIFKIENNLIVRLPKEYRFDSDEVLVNKIGDIVILIPKSSKWDSFIKAIDLFSSDFMEEGRAEQVTNEHI